MTNNIYPSKINDIYIPMDNINEIFKFASFSTKLYLIGILDTKINHDLIITKIPNKFRYKLTDDILSQSKFRKLTLLNARNNKNITDKSIKLLTNLIHLDTSGYKSDITDESIKLLTNLIHLNASYNKNITDKSVKLLTKLTHLEAGGYKSDITDTSIKLLTNLTYLNASDNKNITDASIKLLTKLTSLNASNNENITNASI